MKKIIFAIGIILLFFISVLTPVIFGYKVDTKKEDLIDDYFTFDRNFFPETYFPEKYISNVQFKDVNLETSDTNKKITESILLKTRQNENVFPLTFNGLMDSAWPMYCHDTCHTGLSPYSSVNNSSEEKWWFYINRHIEGCPVINNDGVIYFGCTGYFIALYPDGTLKWKYRTWGDVETSPAIAEDGTVYFGTYAAPGYGTDLFAINPDGTVKWQYDTGDMLTSPAIATDGTIYVADGGSSMLALNPNGTLKWSYSTEHVVLSSPAVDKNGIIYFGSHDNNVYAIYSNGTLKWKFDTGSWVHGCPTIADDGTVYIDSDNGYLYALNPDNGSVIWRCAVGSVWGSPALDAAGNIYVGTWEEKLYSIYPNGNIRWSIGVGQVWGMSPAVSKDGTIYVGTCDFGGRHSGPLYILNNDGTTKKILSHVTMFWSSPAIGSDGTVYICSQKEENKGGSLYASAGYLFALNELDPNAPISPVISGRTSGTNNRIYEYTLKSTSPLGNDIYYWVEWGDLNITSWIGPYHSGEEIKVSHKWYNPGTYHIIAKAKDTDNLWGPWGELTVTMPKSKTVDFNSLFFKLLEKSPFLEKLLFLKRLII